MKRALISVSDKTGIIPFVKALELQGYEIISTGGTKKHLQEAGIQVLSVEEITKFPEILEGRVKTLHPMIHGGLLGKRNNSEHIKVMEEQGIEGIDLVCVNLYPFEETLHKIAVQHEEIIENIDIGGPSMLRSAAKNYEDVVVVCDPQDYGKIINTLPNVSFEVRQLLAGKVYGHTAGYDAMIATYFNQINHVQFPDEVTIHMKKVQGLRYGENAHQSAAVYQQHKGSVSRAKQLHGKELSYNNFQDAYAAMSIVEEFDGPCFVAVKHTNPCGVGFHPTSYKAWRYCYEGDPISIFGGIIATNCKVEEDVANELADLFIEVIIAPSFSEEAMVILQRKKNIRLLEMDFGKGMNELHYKSIGADFLVQEQDGLQTKIDDLIAVTIVKASTEIEELCSIAQRIVKHVKSNAIVLVQPHQCVGVGAGQMNRIGSLELAIQQAKNKCQGAVLASDAFFPMNDSVIRAASVGVQAIIQPGGSIKDQESIDACNEHQIAMYFTNVRHFKH